MDVDTAAAAAADIAAATASVFTNRDYIHYL